MTPVGPRAVDLRRHPAETLHDDTITLRRPTAADAPTLRTVVEGSLDHLSPWMPWAQAVPTVEEYEQVIARWRADWAEGIAYQFLVAAAEDPGPHPERDRDVLVGAAGLMARIGPGALEIGYWVRVDRVRTGIASRAVALLSAAAFGLRDIERVEIHHDEANEPSGRVARAVGFSLARRAARVPLAPGETGTGLVWVLHRTEWIDRQRSR